MAEAHESTIFTKALAFAIIGAPILLWLQLRDGGQKPADHPTDLPAVTRTAGVACPTRELLDRAATEGDAMLVSSGGSCFVMPAGVPVKITPVDSKTIQFRLANTPNGGLMWARPEMFSQ